MRNIFEVFLKDHVLSVGGDALDCVFQVSSSRALKAVHFSSFPAVFQLDSEELTDEPHPRA